MLPSIERLKGRENFDTWKFAVQAYLEHEDLWKCICGSETDTSKDVKAKAKLILLIDPINYVHVQTAKTAREIWIKLGSAFEDKGLTRRVGLLRSLITTKLDDSDSVEDYVTKKITTAHKLNGIGMEISDEWVGTLLLAGLPEAYSPMIMGIESSGVAITSDAIKTKILQDVKTNNVDGEAALFSKDLHGSSRNKAKKKPFKCFECNRTGHFARDCQLKKLKKTEKANTVKTENVLWTSFVAKNAIDNDDWFVDSGASAHMTPYKENLINSSEPTNHEVIVADNSRLKINCVGDVRLCVSNDKNIENVLVKNVQYIPNLCANLLSVSQMVKNGNSLVFDESECKIYNSKKDLVAKATMCNNMYKLNRASQSMSLAVSDKSNNSKEFLWHRRLGHAGAEKLRQLNNSVTNGVDFPSVNFNLCEICLKGKHSRSAFKDIGTRATELLQVIHSDVCGPMNVKSMGGARYFVLFIDDYSRKVFIYLLKTKSEVVDKFIEFQRLVENQTNKTIKVLRTDNGTEYCNKRLFDHLQSRGVHHQTTAPYTPEQNGLAERMNRSIVEKARCMMFDANLNTKFWAEAVTTAVYLINRLPVVGAAKTPEELWSGVRPNLKYLKVFGCKAMMHIPKQRRNKFDPKSTECIMMGYSEHSKAYRLFDLDKQTIVISRDVVFLEDRHVKNMEVINNTNNNSNYFLIDSETESSDAVSGLDNSESAANNLNLETQQQNELHVNKESPEISESHTIFHKEDQGVAELKVNPVNTVNKSTNPLRRSERLASKSNFAFLVNSYEVGDPIDVKSALSRADGHLWQKAMQEEYHALTKNSTWEVVNLPADRRAIDCKWIFKTKCDSTGNIVRHKARLVIKGCAQRKGVDYNEIYSPVVRYSSIRMLLAIAVKLNLQIIQMDAETAFLQGDLEEDIFMLQPEGFSDGTSQVCKLKKSLYGLKQASRIWNNKLNDALINYGLKKSGIDPCIYFRKQNNKLLIVAVYVDDLLIFSNDSTLLKNLQLNLTQQFKMRDLGEAKYVLGLNIEYDRKLGTLSIDQSQYIKEILQRFGMADCNPLSSPMDHNQKLSTNTDMENEQMHNIPYQEAVGSLMYAAQVSRPDISYAVGVVSRFNLNPTKTHWLAVKRILRYLKGTINAKLTYTRNGNCELIGYCDADWAGDVSDRRSTTGYVFVMNDAAISWNSRKQPTVALSSTEAEYMSLTAAIQEAKWLKNLRDELLNDSTKILTICCDNKSAIDLASTTMYHARTKHIDVKYHFIRDTLMEGAFKLDYLRTDHMLADMLTKALVPCKHLKFTKDCGIKI